ncbi:WD40-repeat-containing domain protein [Dunaliella salina]|uniref:WD40-repeat-containing domain protein n=1 Tax=Dunaliella salina TaxID=3046 RepID=A0ABQ7GUT4_DUNSA|nr:WD40-repeat-containing domain protein [Dunaliella salina]|eukprot:KAF5838373.1 WD40-repeat-containing domain protein [Dunaliella salina]
MGCSESKGAVEPAATTSSHPTMASSSRTAPSPAPAAINAAQHGNFPVFLSFRVKEAKPQALALKAALEAHGFATFCSECDIPRGKDWIRTISDALAKCQLVIVLATRTYGAPGTDAFATGEELAFARKNKKELYIVPMADVWEDSSTNVLLGTMQLGRGWTTPPNQVPSDLLADLLDIYKDVLPVASVKGAAQKLQEQQAAEQLAAKMRKADEPQLHQEEAIPQTLPVQSIKQQQQQQQQLQAGSEQHIAVEAETRQQSAVEADREQQSVLEAEKERQLADAWRREAEEAAAAHAREEQRREAQLQAAKRKADAEAKQAEEQRVLKKQLEQALREAEEGEAAVQAREEQFRQERLLAEQERAAAAEKEAMLEQLNAAKARAAAAEAQRQEKELQYRQEMERRVEQGKAAAAAKAQQKQQQQQRQQPQALPPLQLLSSPSCSTTLTGHSSNVNSVAYHPDGLSLVSGSGDGTIKLWSVASGVCTATFGARSGSWTRLFQNGHSTYVNSVAISQDGRLVASGSDDGSVKLWDLGSRKCTATLTGHEGDVRCVAISPDGVTLASASNDRIIKLWDTQSGSCKASLEGHCNWVRCVAFSLDGALLASGGNDDTLRVWDARSARSIAVFKGHCGPVTSVVFSADGAAVLSGSYDGTIKVWDAKSSWQCLKTLGHSGCVNSVALSPDGQYAVSGPGNLFDNDRTIRIWDWRGSGKCLATLKGHSDRVCSVAVSPDGKTLASGSMDNTIKLWRIAQ